MGIVHFLVFTPGLTAIIEQQQVWGVTVGKGLMEEYGSGLQLFLIGMMGLSRRPYILRKSCVILFFD